MKWHIDVTFNYPDGLTHTDSYGPYNLEELQGFLKVALADAEYSSIEIILVPQLH